MSRAVATDLEALRSWMHEHGAPQSPLPAETLPSGFPGLDRILPGGGLPRGGVTVLSGLVGVGRMSVAARWLAKETSAGRPAAWIDARGTLYPPALALLGVDLSRTLIVRSEQKDKALLAAEQIIASGVFRVVITCGVDEALTAVRARRLATTTATARVCAVLILDDPTRMAGSALRLRLARRADRVQIEIERSRGGPSGGRVLLDPHLDRSTNALV